MKAVLVVAGTFEQFTDWRDDHDEIVEGRYVRGNAMRSGEVFQTVEVVGTWSSRVDLEAVLEQLEWTQAAGRLENAGDLHRVRDACRERRERREQAAGESPTQRAQRAFMQRIAFAERIAFADYERERSRRR